MRPITERGRDRLRIYRRRRSDDRAWSTIELTGQVKVPPRRVALPERDPMLRLKRRRFEYIDLRRVGVMAAGGLLVLVGLIWAWSATRVHADLRGVADGAALQPHEAQDMKFRIEVSPSGRLAEATLEFDDVDVLEKAEVRGDVITFDPGPLAEGEHELRLTVPRPVLSDASLTWDFTIDGTPPTILAPPYLEEARMNEPVEITGSVEGADSFFVNGKPAELEGDGEFHLEYAKPPAGPVELAAEDEAGNRKVWAVSAPVPYPEVHGIHVTAHAWDNPTLRDQIIDIIEAGLVDTIELDIKDEGGRVGHISNVPLAEKIGASESLYELRKQVDLMHELGVNVVGRIVAFRDPVLAEWAWANGRRDLVIQSPEGDRYGAYDGGFTSFASKEVQDYNIALAVEAANAGVDDIMYDYVRRPEGNLDAMRVPGLKGDPEDAIIGFLERSHGKLRALGVYQGAAVFGVAVSRPEQSGQNILGMAYHTDYIAPMLYPSHWNVGEYGISDPEREPYEIIKRSLGEFRQAVTRTGRPLVPWIQHFSLNVTYSTDEVVAQVRAAEEMGFGSWMMWDPAVSYDVAALEQSMALSPDVDASPPGRGAAPGPGASSTDP